MGDAFRGLTLRLGADARPVQQALSSISSAASKAQSQLNRMDKALKFAGASSSVKALASRVDLAGDKARLAAKSFGTIKSAIEQAEASTVQFAGKTRLTTKNLGQVADRVKEAYSSTQNFRSAMNHVNNELSQIDDAMSKIYQKERKLNFTQARKAVADLRRNFGGLDTAGEKATAEIDRLLGIIAKGGTVKGFQNLEGDAEKLRDTYRKLRSESSRLNTNLTSMGRVEGLQALRREAILAESSLREASAQMTRMKAEAAAIGSSEAFAKMKSDIKGMDSAIDASLADLRTFEAAYKAAPRSVDAMRNSLKATKAAQEALTDKAKALKTAISSIESRGGIKELSASVSNINTAFSRASSAATEARMEFDLARAKVAAFKAELSEAKNASFIGPTRAIKNIEADISAAAAEMDKLRSKAKSADQSLEQMAQVRELHGLKSELSAVGTELSSLKAKSSALNTLRSAGKGLREFGFGLYASVTPAIMMTGRYAVQAAQDIDSSYRDMRKTVNGTEEQFVSLKQAALDYSKTHVTSADKILEIEAMGGQLGIAADSLEAFSTTISNLDIATNIDADTAAEQLGKMASVLGLTTDEYDNFGDALVRLGNNMPVMESDIMTLTTRYMGMGKVVGMTADQMLAWSAAASATGQKSEAAGSAMQRFISNIETAVTSGGSKLEKFASIAGMSADEFSTAFKTDASDAMYQFVKGLGDMQKRGESVNQALKDLGINNVRDKQLLEGLANQMANAKDGADLLSEALKMSSEAFRGMDSQMADGTIERAGDAAREAARKAEGFSGALEMMKNQAKALAVEMSDGAAPIVQGMADMFGQLTNAFSKLPKEVKTGIVAFAGLLAAVGPLSVMFGTIAQTSARVISGISGISNAVVRTGTRLSDWGALASGAALNTEKGLMKAGKAASVFGKALQFIGSGPGLLAIGGAAVGIKMIADRFQEAAEKSAEFKKATEGVTQASNESFKLTQQNSDAFDELIDKPKTAAKSYEELVKAQTDLVDRTNERNRAAAEEISTLNGAEEALTRYLNKTNLTVSEQQRLKEAVELLNEKYGQNLSVIDLENGKIADNTGAIMQNADAVRQLIEEKKRAAKIDVLTQNLAEQEVAADNAAASYANAAKEYKQFESFATNMPDDTWVQWGNLSGTVQEVRGQLKGTMDAEKAMLDTNQAAADATARRLDEVANSADRTSASVKNLVAGQGAVNAFFGNDTIGLEKFASEVEKCGVSVEDFYNISSSQWGEILSRWSEGGADLATILSDVGVKTHTLGDQLSAEFARMGGDMEALKARAGGDIEGFAQKLSDAGISASRFAEMGIQGFDNLMTVANNDMSNIGNAMAQLDAYQINPKNIYFSDEPPGFIDTTTGKLYEFDAAAGTITATERVFKFNEDGTLEEITGKVKEMDGQEVTTTVEAEAQGVEEAQAQVDGLYSDVEAGASGNVDITANDQATDTIEGAQSAADEFGSTDAEATVSESDASGAKSEIEDAQGAADRFGGTNATATISVNDYASGAIESVRANLAALDGSSATVTIHEQKNAAGGIIPSHAAGGVNSRTISRIPMHADGGINGIVTRATRTNVGWVGEAGDEAILHMRHAGGAIIPLSNRRHVRPFARAVAAEMGGGGNSTVNNYTIKLQYDAGADATQMVYDIAHGIKMANLMEA